MATAVQNKTITIHNTPNNKDAVMTSYKDNVTALINCRWQQEKWIPRFTACGFCHIAG